MPGALENQPGISGQGRGGDLNLLSISNNGCTASPTTRQGRNPPRSTTPPGGGAPPWGVLLLSKTK